MLAVDVISAIIKYFKDLVLERFNEKNCNVKETDIRWVLSLPASLHDDARWFRKTATKVRFIRDLSLNIGFEALSVYSKNYHATRYFH